MRNNNEFSSVDAGGYGQSGVPSNVIAPTFIQPNPTPAYAPAYSPYAAAPVAAVGGFGNGGFLETIIAASLLGNRGLIGGDCGAGTTVLEQNVSDLRKDVADNGKEIHVLGNEVAGMFAAQNLANAGEFRNLDNQICNSEKEAIKAGYEAKIATLQSTNEITNKIDASTVDVKNQLFGISTVMAAEFCDTKHLIERGNAEIALQAERNKNDLSMQMERGFCKIADDALRAQLASLLDERDCYRRERQSIVDSAVVSQQTNSILAAIDSQLQKQTNQIVQFSGLSSVATPTTTSTQNTVN